MCGPESMYVSYPYFPCTFIIFLPTLMVLLGVLTGLIALKPFIWIRPLGGNFSEPLISRKIFLFCDLLKISPELGLLY